MSTYLPCNSTVTELHLPCALLSQVRLALRRLSRQQNHFRLVHNAEPDNTWSRIEQYHHRMHGSNWLTKRYFEMMQSAAANNRINFRLFSYA